MNQGTDCLEPATVEQCSLRYVSRQELNEYKWIESERAGYDLGESAVRSWIKQHWSGFLRARWIEHLQGRRFWIELNQEEFGLLGREFPNQEPLLNEVVSRLVGGAENLGLMCWAHQAQRDGEIEHLIQILERLDINSHRLKHEYDND